MLLLLSPAKSLDFTTALPTKRQTEPRTLEQSAELIEVLRTKTVPELASLMHISDELAALNAERYRDFVTRGTPDGARPAVFAFAGDTYRGLDVASFSARDLTEASKTVRILSGLYGLLRPLDLIQPYRLEMGSRLRTDRGRDLYEWWGDRITDLVAADLADAPGSPVVVNLASVEYFNAVDPLRLGARIISPRFEDRGPGGAPRIVSFHAKRARGMMAAWLVKVRARTPARIRAFDGGGYAFDGARSTPDVPVFVR